MGHKEEEINGIINDFVIRLAHLYVVARCRCNPIKLYHSDSHLDCFSVDEWLIDEFREGSKAFAKQLEDCRKGQIQTPLPQVRISSAESLQIEADSLCSTSRNGK